MSDFASRALTSLAWLAAMLTVLGDRLLLPLLLVCIYDILQPTAATLQPALDPDALQRLTRRQLQGLAGTRRNLPKGQLIDLVHRQGVAA